MKANGLSSSASRGLRALSSPQKAFHELSAMGQWSKEAVLLFRDAKRPRAPKTRLSRRETASKPALSPPVRSKNHEKSMKNLLNFAKNIQKRLRRASEALYLPLFARDLEYDRVNAALDSATQAYAGFQLQGDLEAMADCVRLVAHALQRQGQRLRAIEMATQELESGRQRRHQRVEAPVYCRFGPFIVDFFMFFQ